MGQFSVASSLTHLSGLAKSQAGSPCQNRGLPLAAWPWCAGGGPAGTGLLPVRAVGEGAGSLLCCVGPILRCGRDRDSPGRAIHNDGDSGWGDRWWWPRKVVDGTGSWVREVHGIGRKLGEDGVHWSVARAGSWWWDHCGRGRWSGMTL
jgi:hypothetical protein